ncbi:MAG: hypothetical protein J6X79_00600 [Bacteroidales bacterium]|nr:hypothetical protein [Bacteroidales bacterium]
MKKHYLLLVLAVLGLTACDPGYDEDVAFKNSSLHVVTVVPSDYYSQYSDTTVVYENEAHTLAVGEELLLNVAGGLGVASREEAEGWFRIYYSDSVIFRFDDEKQVVFYKDDSVSISPYNFNSANYQYEEKLNKGITFHGYPYYGKLTFTITDEHYRMAE